MTQVELIDPDDGSRRWRFDAEFLSSNWTCIWGRGCQGILDEPAEHLGHGCCSVGAQMLDEDEASMTATLAATLDPAHFQFAEVAATDGVFADERRTNTRVIDGACIFLNRIGFDGGPGCALHLAALADEDSPTDWKPSVCWQLPVKVEHVAAVDGAVVSTVRPWSRGDWGPEGDAMAWVCTEESDAFVGDRPVVESLGDELSALLGAPLYEQLRDRLARRGALHAEEDERP